MIGFLPHHASKELSDTNKGWVDMGIVEVAHGDRIGGTMDQPDTDVSAKFQETKPAGFQYQGQSRKERVTETNSKTTHKSRYCSRVVREGRLVGLTGASVTGGFQTGNAPNASAGRLIGIWTCMPLEDDVAWFGVGGELRGDCSAEAKRSSS